MNNYLPNDVLEREKKGFSAPDSSWFRGESLSYVKSKIMKTNVKRENLACQVLLHSRR